MRFFVQVIIVVALIVQPIQAASPRHPKKGTVPFDNCTMKHHVSSLFRFADLPEAVRTDLTDRAGTLADRGEPFNSTDVVTNGDGPGRRFIRAVQSEDNLFVWYEHGGIGLHVHVLAYDIGRASGIPLQSAPANLEANYVTFNPCAATDAYLDGVYPAAEGDF